MFSVIGHSDFDASPDLILTEDHNGVNAGLFFIRRSKWSERFLDTWWNHTSFVQFGSTKSGDNAALKHIIGHLSPEETQAHVRIAKLQCIFNSYPWMTTWKSVHRLIVHPSSTWKGFLICLITIHSIDATRIFTFDSEKGTRLILKDEPHKSSLDLSSCLLCSCYFLALPKVNLAGEGRFGSRVQLILISVPSS